MPSGFQMLLIASSRALSAVEGTGIMAVTMPLSVYELVNTLEMMMLQSAARRRKKERAKPKVRSAEEQHIIDRAKKPSDRTKSHDRVGGPSLHAEMQHGQRHQSG